MWQQVWRNFGIGAINGVAFCRCCGQSLLRRWPLVCLYSAAKTALRRAAAVSLIAAKVAISTADCRIAGK
jgi:hypothetical protein